MNAIIGVMDNKNAHNLQAKGGGVKLSAAQAGRISHDFRSALNVVAGFTELLLDEAPGKINEEQRLSLNDILNSSRRLNDLVNEVFGQTST